MVFSNWKDAVKSLEIASQPVTDKQLEIAKTAGITIPPKTPSVVAAAMLRVALFEELDLDPAHQPSDYSTSALEQFGTKAKQADKPKNEDEAKAWLSYFRFQQRLKCHKELKLETGDIVKLGEFEFAEVSSIDAEGRVFFKGGHGARTWPDFIVSVEARNADDSSTAIDVRRNAQNLAALRTTSPAWSSIKSDDLQEFEVSVQATVEQIDELEDVIAFASDERPIQAFLQENRCLLTTLLGGKERFCIPQKRLGAEYVPDFIIGDVDSLGIRWVVMELETPNSGIYLKDAKALDKFARKGVDQVTDWRNWLQNNIAYAHKPRLKEGLGLADISNLTEAYVLVGRRARMPITKDAKRRELRDRVGTHVHTYDWLLERLRGTVDFNGPPASNPHLIAREELSSINLGRRR
jgi:hypothetical protein